MDSLLVRQKITIERQSEDRHNLVIHTSCRSVSSFNAWPIRQILAGHIGTEDATKKNMPFYLLQLTGEINIKHPNPQDKRFQNIGWPLVLFLISRIHEWIFFDPVETESSQIADKTYDTHLL